MSSKKGIEDRAAVNSFSSLSEHDHQSLVIEYNNTTAPYPSDKTVVELFESQVERTPEEEAIRLGGQWLTYRELNARANQMAAKLRTLGIETGQFVAIYMGHSIEVVCAMLGVLKAGAAYVPVDIATPKGRLAFILQDIAKGLSGTLPVLVTQSSFVSGLPIGASNVVTLDADFVSIEEYPVRNLRSPVSPDNLAYVIYTSGSTGTPKGVMIEHRSLVNYIWWANEKYCKGERLIWPLFSSLAFDLTVTSIFTPLISGGRIIVYREDPAVHGTGIFKVIEDNAVDIVKLTPAHLAMIKDMVVSATKIRKFIVGGEDFKTELASYITRNVGNPVDIYNEYGPTEATVGCMIHRYDKEKDLAPSVPIGIPAANTCIFILDEHLSPVPIGEVGEMYIAGDGLARGYFNRLEFTEEKFIKATDPRQNGPEAKSSIVRSESLRLYKTGDIARWNANGNMEFLGRTDNQVKVGGVRIELGEIEACLQKHADVRECVVNVVNSIGVKASKELYFCRRCGIATNVPGISYDAEGVCNTCRSYETYVEKAQAYFKTKDELKAIIAEMKAARTGDYDCLVLFSGGKDSTYMLYQLCGLGVKPLAFTLDHDFISEETRANINRTVQSLGVELVTGRTAHMNEIFVDSIKQFSNVCNGCFKTIYTLATNIAHEKGIRYIVTGLSRGQFFETRLNEEFFKIKDYDIAKMDALVLEARKAYHRREDAISCYLNVDIFRDDKVFKEIQFVDFYRYVSVPLEEIYAFLHKYASWGRPSDTGRSTNCLINDVGIYLHKKQRGFHHYALPYSWDVRLGQKTRDEAMEELDDEIDEARVKQIMTQIGYTEPPNTDETSINLLVAYYVSEKSLTVDELRAHLAQEYPAFMLPQYFIRLDKLPLTPNGKIDRKALPAPTSDNLAISHDFVRPHTETEKALAAIWIELLKVEFIGINNSFFELGGHSLLAIQAVSRIRDVFEVDLPIQTFFEFPTIAGLSNALTEAKGFGEGIQGIEHRKQDGQNPLSFGQEQLLFLHQLAPSSPAYNFADVIRINGEYDAEAMRNVMKELVRRHEILRTSFSNVDGQPMQIVMPTIDLALPELDLTSLSEQEREHAWNHVIREEVQKPFDLFQTPLLRGTMVHRTHHEHQLLLTFHHIIADEWSMELIHQEIKQLYEAFSQSRPSPLPELSIQFADFARWQRDWLQGDLLERQISYWKEELAEAPCVLELPTDKPRPAVLSFRGATEIFELPKELLERVKSLGRQEQATLFMILEACFMVLLHRYTGQDDILIGTPISGRTRSETENLIGYFLNTVVLRAKFTDRLGFRSLLQQVRERALRAYGHPDLPFEYLVAELAPERDPSRMPLFQVMFVVHNPQGVSEVSKVSGNRKLETGTSKFDLTLVISETEKGLEGLIEYSTDLFEAETIRRMCGHYGTLLEAIARDPDQEISMLPMLTDAERQQLLVDWNQTTSEYPLGECLHQLFEAQVMRTPENVAVEFEKQQLTYLEFNRRANQLAHYLLKLGVGPEKLVGVYMERSLEMVVGLYGIIKAGGAYVPLDPEYPVDRVAYMLEDTCVPVVLTQKHLLERLPSHKAEVICLDSDWDKIAGERTENPASGVKPENLAYVIYTSGSTGKPKGVMNEHRGIVNRLLWMQDEYGLTESDRVIQKTPYSFDVSVWEFFWPLLVGSRLVVAAPGIHREPDGLIRLIKEKEITTIHFVPSMLYAFLEEDDVERCSCLTRVICSGEALTYDLKERFFERLNCELHNLYGPTEAAVDVTFWKCEKGGTRKIVPIGRPVANTQMYILDSFLQPVPIGVTGELHIGGVQVARGYLNRPDLTKEKFIPDPFNDMQGARLYKTGDLARCLPDGAIEYLGRNDFQVKIRGLRIELGEIEAVLRMHEGVKDSVVMVREHQAGKKQLLAYVMAKGPVEPSVSELHSFLKAKLADYMIPSNFVLLEAFPMTPSGKLDRKALPVPESSQPKLEDDFVAPRTPNEKALADIWSQVLRIERVGIHDNFFGMGGDSILSFQVIAKARKAGLRLMPKHIFQYQTISGLAAVAENIAIPGMEQGLVTGDVPLTPIQYWFFEQNFTDPHHWNQAVWLDLSREIATTLLEQAFQHLIIHHDALRMRFRPLGTGWSQFNVGADETPSLTHVDLSGLNEAEKSSAMQRAAADVQAQINLEEGPLFRTVLFYIGGSRANRLLIVIHHLVIDGVSWRILLEDLQTIYQQLHQGDAVRLPEKTTSFKRWAQRLAEFARSSAIEEQRNYWLTFSQEGAGRLPVDFSGGENTEASAGTISVSLDGEETSALIQQVPHAYNTQINDVLLSALATALGRWSGQSTVCIYLEGHGREELFEGIDLSRTVGWFTTLFPVRFDLRGRHGTGDILKSIKEQLRRIPQRGIGFGLLRYLSGIEETAGQLQALPQAEVVFNYLGQFDQTLSADSVFQLVHESTGPLHSMRAQRSNLLEINGLVANGRLQLNWIYSEKVHHRTTIEMLANNFMEALRELILHCTSPEAKLNLLLEKNNVHKIEFKKSQKKKVKLSDVNKLIGLD